MEYCVVVIRLTAAALRKTRNDTIYMSSAICREFHDATFPRMTLEPGYPRGIPQAHGKERGWTVGRTNRVD